MLEFRIHGRGGQGAQVGCQTLAAAFFRAGRYVQAFAAYGGERRGAPVIAFLRVDDAPIRLRCDVERADHLLVLDATLLADLPRVTLRDGGCLVVNATVAPEGWSPPASRVVAVDASAIAARVGLGGIVAPAMLGALAGATGLLDLDDLAAAVEAGSPARRAENREACRAGWRAATESVLAPAGVAGA